MVDDALCHGSCRLAGAAAAGIEGRLVFEHGASDREEAVGDAAQGAGMSVTAGSEGGVFGLADGVVLHGDAGPVVDRVLQPVVGGEAADDDQGLARAPGDRGGAGQASQGLIVSPLQRIMRFCEQRGEDDPADAGKRAQDFHVTLLLPSRPVLRGGQWPASTAAMKVQEMATQRLRPETDEAL